MKNIPNNTHIPYMVLLHNVVKRVVSSYLGSSCIRYVGVMWLLFLTGPLDYDWYVVQ